MTSGRKFLADRASIQRAGSKLQCRLLSPTCARKKRVVVLTNLSGSPSGKVPALAGPCVETKGEGPVLKIIRGKGQGKRVGRTGLFWKAIL